MCSLQRVRTGGDDKRLCSHRIHTIYVLAAEHKIIRLAQIGLQRIKFRRHCERLRG
jgi:hypothetical protein